MPKRTRPPDPPPEDTADTEQRILDAAHVVFLRQGTAGARMQEIADEAGVNKALLHYYFRSKSRLADAVFQRIAAQILPPVFRVLASDADIEEKVRLVVAHELDQLARAPYAPAYLINELNQNPARVQQMITAVTGLEIHGVGATVRDTLDRQLRARARAGTLRPIGADQFVANLVALCVFPFIARPMLSVALGLDDDGFHKFIEKRKRTLPAFFLNALRP